MADKILAERLGDLAMAEKAVAQIDAAFEAALESRCLERHGLRMVRVARPGNGRNAVHVDSAACRILAATVFLAEAGTAGF